MALWKPRRSPDQYPVWMHAAVAEAWRMVQEQSPHQPLIQIGGQREMRLAQLKFRAFRASCNNYPLHPTSQRLSQLTLRLTLTTTADEIFPWGLRLSASRAVDENTFREAIDRLGEGR